MDKQSEPSFVLPVKVWRKLDKYTSLLEKKRVAIVTSHCTIDDGASLPS